jgi:hypothetical protein
MQYRRVSTNVFGGASHQDGDDVMAKETAKAVMKPHPEVLVVSKPFDNYSLHYYGGVTLQNNGPGADIDCFAGTTRIGSIRFFKDDVIMPANAVGSDGTVVLYYEMSRYNDVVTTLRYEKPLHLVVNPATGFGYVGSGEMEPVGEEE